MAKRLPIRWLTLAEIVGLAALVIAGLGYWDNHRERLQQDRERSASERERADDRKAAVVKQSFVMTGAADDAGDRIRLNSVHADQVIQTQTLWFPTDLRSGEVETTGNPRIEAGWIESGVRKHAKGSSGRVPVGVLTVFIEDGETKTDRALYQVGYHLQKRTLRPDQVTLEGLSLARRGVAGDLQKAADTLWAAQ